MAKAKKNGLKNKPAESEKKTGKGQMSLAPKPNQKAGSGKNSGKGKAETKEVSQEKGRSASKKISVRSEIDRLEKKSSRKILGKSKEKSTNIVRKGAPKSAGPGSKVKGVKKRSEDKSDKTKKNIKTAAAAPVMKQSKKNTSDSKSTARKPSLSKGVKENKAIKGVNSAEREGKAKSGISVKKDGNKKKTEISPKAKNSVPTSGAKEKKKGKIIASTQNRKIRNAKELSSGKSTKKDAGDANLSLLQDLVRVNKKSEKMVPEKHAPVILKKKGNEKGDKKLQESIKPAAEILQDFVPQMKRERKIKLGETKDLWEFYSDQDGDFLAKLYTEDKSVYTELLKIKEIKRSAKYFRNGSFIGADFIIPYDRLKQVCGIAGLKAPKI